MPPCPGPGRIKVRLDDGTVSALSLETTDACCPRRRSDATVRRTATKDPPMSEAVAEKTISERAFNEMLDEGGQVRPHYRAFAQWLAAQPPQAMAARRLEADLNFRRIGITFSMAGDADGTERLIPFDLIPRVIPAAEWRWLDRGL